MLENLRRELKKLRMSREKNYLALLTLLSVFFCSCNNSYNYKRINEKSLIEIYDTNYELNGMAVVYLYSDISSSYYDFPKSSYFITDSNKIDMLGIYPICESDYKAGRYSVILNFKSDSIDSLNGCDIFVSPFVDFNMKRGNGIHYSDHHYLYLKHIYYSTFLDDTSYVFERFNEDSAYRTVVSVTKKFEVDFIFNLTLEKGDTMVTDLLCNDMSFKEFYPNVQKVNTLTSDDEINHSGYVELKNIRELKTQTYLPWCYIPRLWRGVTNK